MKRLAILLLCIVLPTVGLSQVSLVLKFEHKSVLQFEPIIARVVVKNTSGIPLVVDGSGGGAKLKFLIEQQRHVQLKIVGTKRLVPLMVLRPGDFEAVQVDIRDRYSMNKMGQYLVKAVIDIGYASYASEFAIVDIVRGIFLKKEARGVIGSSSEMRLYSLRYWRRDGMRHLFLTVSDLKETMNYGVFDLGEYLGIFEPEIEFDGKGNMTIIHQSGNEVYTRTVFNTTIKAITLAAQTQQYADGAPYPASEVKRSPKKADKK